MPYTPDTTTHQGEPTIYRIRVKGHLGQRWEQWFAPMTIATQPNGDSLLTGPVVDQAALHGILTRIRDLGLPLISIIAVDPSQANSPGTDKE